MFFVVTEFSATAGAQAARPQTQAASVETLFSFAGGKGGSAPVGGLAALNGKLYGATAAAGGVGKVGTAFAFDPATNGLEILHAFRDVRDGEQPYAGPIGFNDMLYGTTFQGGAVGFGTLYRIDPASGQLRTLHSSPARTMAAIPKAN